MTKSKFLTLFKQHIFSTHGTQAAAAEHWKVSNNFVSLVVNGIRKPNEQMLNDAGVKITTITKYTRAK